MKIEWIRRLDEDRGSIVTFKIRGSGPYGWKFILSNFKKGLIGIKVLSECNNEIILFWVPVTRDISSYYCWLYDNFQVSKTKEGVKTFTSKMEKFLTEQVEPAIAENLGKICNKIKEIIS